MRNRKATISGAYCKDESKSYPATSFPGPEDRDHFQALTSSDSVGKQKSHKADYDWEAPRNKEKQRLDLDKNQSDNRASISARIKMQYNGEALTTIFLFTVLAFAQQCAYGRVGIAIRERKPAYETPCSELEDAELIGRFEHAASPRMWISLSL
jgi:hypothetical protein